MKIKKPVEVPFPVLTYPYLPKRHTKMWCGSSFKLQVNSRSQKTNAKCGSRSFKNCKISMYRRYLYLQYVAYGFARYRKYHTLLLGTKYEETCLWSGFFFCLCSSHLSFSCLVSETASFYPGT